MKVARAVLLAIIIVGATSLAYSQQVPTEQTGASKPSAEKNAQDRHPSPIIVQLLPAPKTQQETEQEQQERTDTSKTNWWIVKLTGFVGFIGFMQLIVFGYQAWKLRQTVDAAAEQASLSRIAVEESAKSAAAMEAVAKNVKISANAALEALEINRAMANRHREYNEIQLRAYVLMGSISISNIADAAPGLDVPSPNPNGLVYPQAGPITHMAIKNFGNTPANDVIHWAEISIREYPLTSELPEVMQAEHATRMPLTTGNITTKWRRFPRPLTAEEIAGLRNCSLAIYVYGGISYTDIFGKARSTKFCFYHNQNTGGIGITTDMTGYESGNDYS